MNALSAALAGITAADRQLGAAASRVATDPDADVPAEMVAMRAAQVQQRASVAVARTVSETLGTLLDTFA